MPLRAENDLTLKAKIDMAETGSKTTLGSDIKNSTVKGRKGGFFGKVRRSRLLINGVILLLALICVLFPLYELFYAADVRNASVQKQLEKELSQNGGVIRLQGSGTLTDPYRIRCKSELLYMKMLTDTEETAVSDTYSIENDIDLTIGEGSQSVILGDCEYTFNGILLGNGHTISNLRIDNPEGNAGLFKSLSGTVTDLNVEGTVQGAVAGGIAASLEPDGIIANCRADVEAAGEVAGCVAGYSYGTIINTVACRGNALAGDAVALPVNSFRKSGGKYLNVEDGLLYTAKETEELLNAGMGRLSGKGGIHLRSAQNGLGYLEETAVIPDHCVLVTENETSGALRNETSGALRNETSESLRNETTGNLGNDTSGNCEIEIGGFFSPSEGRWIIPAPKTVLKGAGKVVLSGEKGKKKENVELLSGEAVTDLSMTYGGCEVFVQIVPYENVDALYLNTAASNGLSYLQDDKHHELPGTYRVYDEKTGEESAGQFAALSGRGNDSFGSYEVWKNGYSLVLDGRTSLLGMTQNDDYVLLAGYRYESLLTYLIERDWCREMNALNAYDYRLVQLYLDNEYRGLYMLTGSQEVDEGRFDLRDIQAETQKLNDKALKDYPQVTEEREDGSLRVYYDIPGSPRDVTGGYLLEVDYGDYPDSRARFRSTRGTTLTMKGNPYASKAQVDYAADLWQSFEDAVYSEDGYNAQGGYYADYLDLDSMADLCLTFEITEDTAISASVYFFKDAGEDKLHAAPHWDVEHSFTKHKYAKEGSWFTDRKQEKYETEGAAFWKALESHEDFLALMAKKWDEKYRASVELMLSEGPLHHEGGLSSVEWYRSRYSDLFAINDRLWRGNFNKKCDEIQSFLKVRLEAFEGFIGRYR